MLKNYKNEIFEILSKMDNRDYNFFDNFENIDELQPYTLLRWLSGVSRNNKLDEFYTIMTNTIVNNNFFNLSEEKRLMIKLLCSCGGGNSVKHTWYPIKKTNENKNKKILKSLYSHLKDDEFENFYKNLTKDDINEIFQNFGINDQLFGSIMISV